MMKRFQQNQCAKLKEHFREHPYYKLCKTVFKVFQEVCPTMIMTPEHLFVDASLTLDSIIQTGDIFAEQCQNLWTEKYNQYREQDGTAADKDDTMSEVAMLFYMVMFGLTAVNHSHYRSTLQRTLHACVHKLYNDKCIIVEQKISDPVNQHTNEMMAWMAEYMVSEQSLTKEIEELIHPNRKAGIKDTKKKKEHINYTIPYNCPDGNMRIKRLTLVMLLWQAWKWIEEPQNTDDFISLFSGDARNCNLKWKGKLYILTELMKQLLDQHYIEKVTGLSARSIVMNQFGKNPSGNRERIDVQAKERINMTLDILNYNKPIHIPNDEECESNSDLALQAVFAQELHIIKDLNRKFE